MSLVTFFDILGIWENVVTKNLILRKNQFGDPHFLLQIWKAHKILSWMSIKWGKNQREKKTGLTLYFFLICYGAGYSQLPNKQDVGIRGMDGRTQTNSKRDGRNKSHGCPIRPSIPLISDNFQYCEIKVTAVHRSLLFNIFKIKVTTVSRFC